MTLDLLDAPVGTTPAEDRPATTPPARRRRPRVAALAGGLVLLTVLAWALVPDLLTSASPLYGDVAQRLLPPGPGHWLGTDQLGRDVLTRLVHGARPSVVATTVAVLVATGGGLVLGLLAGYLGGLADALVSRVCEVLLAVPGLLLSLTIIAALGFGTVKVGLAVGVAGIPTAARVTRNEVLRVRTSLFVEAARTSGARTRAVLTEHVLPHAVGPALALAVLEVGSAVLAVSALSFLGFGAPPPAPEWGTLIADGRSYLATAWWLTALPGVAVVAVVLATHAVGRALEGPHR